MRFTMVFLTILTLSPTAQSGREYFVDVIKIIPTIEIDVRYHSNDNFVGSRVDGYKKPVILITKEAGEALKKIQTELRTNGLALKIYDAYRPQKAVNHFVRWAQTPADTLTKSKYYPRVNKKDVFKLGFVASRSGHTRGSTVDLTLIYLDTKKEVDMGSGWDFFGEISSHSTAQITAAQTANRQNLKSIMSKYGFKTYSKEWWHYTLRDEPFPKRYFDFDVE